MAQVTDDQQVVSHITICFIAAQLCIAAFLQFKIYRYGRRGSNLAMAHDSFMNAYLADDLSFVATLLNTMKRATSRMSGLGVPNRFGPVPPAGGDKSVRADNQEASRKTPNVNKLGREIRQQEIRTNNQLKATLEADMGEERFEEARRSITEQTLKAVAKGAAVSPTGQCGPRLI